MAMEIEPARPDSTEAQALIDELETHLAARYPVESRHGYSVEKLLRSGVQFFIVWVDGQAAGCGGVQLYSDYGELKRMYVRPVFRGQRLGEQLLKHLEGVVREAGLPLLRLETGVFQEAAIRLYEGYGFKQIPPFGEYFADPNSLCYEKPISGD